MSFDYLAREQQQRFEYPILILLATTGMLMLISAADLIALYIGLELMSLALYVVAAINRDSARSSEAGLKYFILGALSSGMLLYGASLVYGFTGTVSFAGIAKAAHPDSIGLIMGLVFLFAGFCFKVSAVPFHMWTPDVYEGAPTAVTAWMSAATKIAALVLAMRLMVTAFPQNEHLWSVAFAAIAVASLAIGNLAALVQTNVKRILAYSSVSQAGFMLIGLSAASPLGARALMFYLIPYSAMAFGSFAIVAARERELGEPVTLENLAGFGWERPFLGFAMWIFMLGFTGLPVSGLFVGKFYVFAAAYEHGWAWLVVVGVFATLVSLYYYLGVVRAMYMRRPELVLAGGSPPRDRLTHIAVGAALVVSVGSLFAVAPLIDLARNAASALPF
jgi:NADH-quinone oxidoreductase subunit N